MVREQMVAAVEALDDVADADTARCLDLLARAKRLRGWVDAVEARIASRMRELQVTAGGVGPAEAHTQCGGVSGAGTGRLSPQGTGP